MLDKPTCGGGLRSPVFASSRRLYVLHFPVQGCRRRALRQTVPARGFSLTELMVALLIAGILTAIALPTYNDYVMRGNIPSATAYLASERVKLEQYFQDNKSYTSAPVCVTDTTSSNVFQFSCTVGSSGGTYVLTATGVGSMAGFVYTVDQSNARSSTVPTGWTLPTPNTCWVTSKSGTC